MIRRLAVDSASPLITFYDDETGERTELSATTFDNWVAKTANLLVDGLGFGPGDVATLRLPVHWQSLVVLAGCWRAGLEARTTDGPADVVFVAEGWPDNGSPTSTTATETVALALRPLGAGLLAPSESGVTDYATTVRSFGDRFGGPNPAPDAPGLDGRSHRELVDAATEVGTGAARVLLAAPGDPGLDFPTVLASYLGPLSGGGSCVLCRHADPAALPRRLETERAISA